LLSSPGVDGRAVVKPGQVAATIVREAKRGYRLLVVGHRGMTGLARFVIGSVALHVVRSASCPVLVVKQVSRQVSRMLVAVDGSDASDRIVRFLTTELRPTATNSEAQFAEPAVAAVIHHVLPFVFKSDEAEMAGRTVVQHYGQKLAKAGYRIMEEVTFGGPAEELTAMAKRRKVNLIVAGAKGMGNVASFLLGSVATRLVERSRCWWFPRHCVVMPFTVVRVHLCLRHN
jgi:nucleotide-binding universal stress UspA family protein